MDEIAYIYGPYLAHHGIKGQRWGYRRWQNPDGSLTEAGYKHYGRGIPKALKNHRAKSIAKTDKSINKLQNKKDAAKENVRKATINEVKYGKAYTQSLNRETDLRDQLYKKENGLTAKLIGANGWSVRRLNKKIDKQNKVTQLTKSQYEQAKIYTADMQIQLADVSIALGNETSNRKIKTMKFIDQYGQDEYSIAAKRYNFNE